MKSLVVMVFLAAAACGSSSTSKMDAPRPLDASNLPDSKVFQDAPVPSTVNVVANCTGVAAGDIGATVITTGFTFNPTAPTITAGQYLKFTTTSNHNFQNQPGAPPESVFDSGPPGAQTTCLQFTVAGSYPFECVVHASMGMVGTLTVN